MLYRILLIIFGLLSFFIVIFLGIEASSKSNYVIWFGLASALLAPAGFTLITLAFRNNNDKLLQQLSKVPEIKVLIEKAQTQEEKIKALELERASLEDTIKYETFRSILLEKKNTFELEAEKLIENLENIEDNLLKLDKDIAENINIEIIQKLRIKLKEQEQDTITIKLYDKDIAINVAKVRNIPFVGEFAIAYLKLVQDIFALLDRIFKKKFITK